MLIVRHFAREFGTTAIAWAVACCAISPLQANAQIKSADGQIEITVDNDGLMKVLNKKHKFEWQFPHKGSDTPRGTNFQTTFAPNTGSLIGDKYPSPLATIIIPHAAEADFAGAVAWRSAASRSAA